MRYLLEELKLNEQTKQKTIGRRIASAIRFIGTEEFQQSKGRYAINRNTSGAPQDGQTFKGESVYVGGRVPEGSGEDRGGRKVKKSLDLDCSDQTDSDGNPLSKAQAEFFKDSKLRKVSSTLLDIQKRETENRMLPMDLEAYKTKVEANLNQRVGKNQAARLMKVYEDDFPELLSKNLSIEATATALLAGY